MIRLYFLLSFFITFFVFGCTSQTKDNNSDVTDDSPLTSDATEQDLRKRFPNLIASEETTSESEDYQVLLQSFSALDGNSDGPLSGGDSGTATTVAGDKKPTVYACNALYRIPRHRKPDSSALARCAQEAKGAKYWNDLHAKLLKDINDAGTKISDVEKKYLTDFSSGSHTKGQSVCLLPMLKGTSKSGHEFRAAPESTNDIKVIKVNDIKISKDQYKFAHRGMLEMYQKFPDSEVSKAVLNTDALREDSPYAMVIQMKFLARTDGYASKNLESLSKRERFHSVTFGELDEATLGRIGTSKTRKASIAAGNKVHNIAVLKCEPSDNS